MLESHHGNQHTVLPKAQRSLLPRVTEAEEEPTMTAIIITHYRSFIWRRETNATGKRWRAQENERQQRQDGALLQRRNQPSM